MTDVIVQVRASVGFITLNRPKALNALSLDLDSSEQAAVWEALGARGQRNRGGRARPGRGQGSQSPMESGPN